jgi:hypothetical protein
MGAKIGGALPLQTTPPGANGPLDHGFVAPGRRGVPIRIGAPDGTTAQRPTIEIRHQV